MKKNFAFAAAALLASAAIASAADLPSRAAPAPVYAAPAFTWSGFYVGLNGGYAWGEQSGRGFRGDFSNKGWMLGGTVGAQHQFGNVVLGVEGDIAYANVEHSSRHLNNLVSIESKMNAFGTARVRAGYAFGALLPYVTGGVAVVNTKTSLGFGNLGATSKDTSFGWTVGAGVEYALNNHWSVKGEYLYVHTGDINHSFGGPLTIGARTDGNLHVVRTGVNYRF